MNSVVKGDSTFNQEYWLLDYVERIGKRRTGRKAVHVQLSKLRANSRRDFHLRIATNAFEHLVSLYEGQIFKLANHDLLFVLTESDPLQVDEAMMRLGYLFNDDPLSTGVDPSIIADFCRWYDVATEYDQLVATATALYDDAKKRHKRAALITGAATAEEKPPVNPHHLGALIDTISSADLSNLMRRQVVYALLSKKAPTALFSELFISIPDLRKAILPDYNINANRWLFQYLTETLDRRMLSLLMRNDDSAIANSFSLNLNIATLMSPEFLAFDASLKAGARGTIVLEVQMIDVFADIGTFAFARDFVHDRGYRMCLDGLTEQNFPFVDREKLGIDLVKLDWSQMAMDERVEERQERLRDMIDQAGKARVILCHVDTEEGLKFGQSIGVAMYQGRYIDQLASPRYGGMRPK